MSQASSNRVPSPYGSARDLPSYQEMARQLQGGKLLSLTTAEEALEW